MLLSAVGMGAAAFGFPASIQGALLQEAIIIVSILNSLRIILPARLSDFAEPRPGMSPGSFEPGDKDEAEHELATPSVGR